MARPTYAAAAPPSGAAHSPGHPTCEDSVTLMGCDEARLHPCGFALAIMRCLPRAIGIAIRGVGLQAIGLLVWLCRCAGRQQGA